jgi:hypothetical protein
VRLEAHAEDAAGNVEKRGHVVMWNAGAKAFPRDGYSPRSFFK